MIEAKVFNTENYGEKGKVLNCIEEEGEYYYIIKLKGKKRIMLHESVIEIL